MGFPLSRSQWSSRLCGGLSKDAVFHSWELKKTDGYLELCLDAQWESLAQFAPLEYLCYHVRSWRTQWYDVPRCAMFPLCPPAQERDPWDVVNGELRSTLDT